MTTLLAFDTTGAACSVALWADGRVAADLYEAMPRGQAERLLPMIEETLTAAGARYADLDALAVTRGPGAFTGLRIGLSAARGLALTLGIPALGLTTFEALAVRTAKRRMVAIDTKRQDYYTQIFDDDGLPTADPVIRTAETVLHIVIDSDLTLITDGPLLVGGNPDTLEPGHFGPPRAAEFAALAAGRFERWRAEEGAQADAVLPPPRPLYLRAPEARLPDRRS